ncbi:MAG: hypothetical protein KAI55_03795 [Candidatus Aenigmarchaeota archaeon]|nr:hypothetical protein [Candidatus Aenigmarchaeota archaeon]
MSVDIIILTIAILIILFEKIPLLFNKKSSSKEKRISVILIILLISSLGLVAYKEFKSDQYSKSSGVIDDDLKPKISNIIINVGPGIDIISGDLKEFKREDSGAPLFDGLDIWIEDDKLKISSTIRDESEQIIAKLEANEWQVNPNKIFDRNFDNKGIEVIDDKGDVILQADIKGYDKLQDGSEAVVVKFRGVFTHPDGWRFILGGDDGIRNSFMQTISPSLNETRIHFDKIFKYPSELHPGERI